MKFGPISVDEAEGALLAHSRRVEGRALKKGRLLSGEDLRLLKAAGVGEVVAARLEPGDVGEDAAATAVANASQGADRLNRSRNGSISSVRRTIPKSVSAARRWMAMLTAW